MLVSLTYFNNFIGEIIKAEWEKLRENYRKCLAKREKATRSGAAAKKLPTCNFFVELSFLRDTLLNRRTESNLPQPPGGILPRLPNALPQPPANPAQPHANPAQPPANLPQTPDNDRPVYVGELTAHDPAAPSTTLHDFSSPFKKQKYENNKKKKANDIQLGIDALLVKALTKDLCPSPEQAPKQGSKEKDDPDLLFCLSLVDTLKRLDGRKKSLAKMKIQEVLFALEFEE